MRVGQQVARLLGDRERVRGILVGPQQQHGHLDQPVGVQQLGLVARPAPDRLAPRPRAVAVAAEVHRGVADQVARGRVAARRELRPLGRAEREPRGVRRDAVEAGHRGDDARRRARLAPRRSGGRCSGEDISTSRPGVSWRDSTARSSSSAPISCPPTSGRGPHVSRTKPASTSASHSGEYWWRGRSSESPCSGRSGSTRRKRSPSSSTSGSHSRCEKPGGVQQRERRPGARLAVGDPRTVGVVVEAELHGALPIVESGPCSGAPDTTARSSRLAFPALGALAAEPLYVLVDTAIVGHLGTPQLASLAIAATVLSTAFTVFNFLTYGTTAQVARLHGAGREEEAAAPRRAGAVAVADHRAGPRRADRRAGAARSPC